ncbi:hypothetical protein [Teichococcus aestuarii]|uniref:hypothetical protein n=1 Tax=Teichococcus aestuarii TaxID=568898 RepID=UPI003621D0F3
MPHSGPLLVQRRELAQLGVEAAQQGHAGGAAQIQAGDAAQWRVIRRTIIPWFVHHTKITIKFHDQLVFSRLWRQSFLAMTN